MTDLVTDWIDDQHVLNGDIAQQQKVLLEYKRKLNTAKSDLESIEATVLLNGNIDGKNSEIRAAQLLKACEDDAEWQTLTERINHLQGDLDDATVEYEHHIRQYQVQNRLIDYCIALKNERNAQ